MTREPETPAEREARIQRILRQMEAKLREKLPDPHQTLEQIEQEVVEIGRGLRAILERETLDAAGTGYRGSQTACACGQGARFVRVTPRTVVTLNGERPLRRAYYYCAACRQGFCPLDQRFLSFVGIDPKKLLAELKKGKGDGEILEWIQANAKHKRSPWEIQQWSDYMDRRGPDSDAETLAFFAEYVAKLTKTREDIKTWADALELDDFVSFGGKA